MAQAGLQATELVREAYRLLLGDWRRWLVALALPLAIDVLVRGTFAAVYGPQIADLGSLQRVADGTFLLRVLAVLLAGIIAVTLFAVSWHRFALLGAAPALLPAVGADHVRFLLLALALLFFGGFVMQMALALAVTGGSVYTFLALGLVVVAMVYLRFGMVFPATALGRRLRLSQSWAITKGQTLVLFWAHLLGMVPLIVLGLLVSFLMGALVAGMQGTPREGGPGLWLVIAVDGAMNFLVLAVAVGILSAAYRRLAPERTAAGGPHGA